MKARPFSLMSSKIQISNQALYHLGMNSITSLTDTTDPSVQAINNFWEPSRDDVLSEFSWPFATTIGLINRLKTTSVTVDSGLLTEPGGFLIGPFMSVGTEVSEFTLVVGWDYAYSYPAKAAAVWSVFNEASVADMDSQEFETLYLPGPNKRVICSNSDSAFCKYTYKVEDTTIWSSKFSMAFSYSLAAKMAHPLLRNPQLGLEMANAATAIVGEAKRISWSEKIKKPRQRSSTQNCR